MEPLSFFTKYLEIPVAVQEYILTVAEERDIMDVPLEDINGYLAGEAENRSANLVAQYLYPTQDEVNDYV